MDFILSKIEKQINRLESRNEQTETKEYYRSRIEYLILLMLGYLWNKNFEKLDDNKKKKVSKEIIKPPIGNLIYLLDDLDIEREFFAKPTLRQLFEKYRDTRNDKHGHGYLYKEGTYEFLEELKDNYNLLKNSDIFLLNDNISFVVVDKFENETQTYFGIKYLPNGNDENWSCSKKVFDFCVGSLYGFKLEGLTSIYFKVSPFIHIVDESEFYLFKWVCEKRRGEIEYNRINKDGNLIIGWKDFAKQLSLHNLKTGLGKVSEENGTIINIFSPNYERDSHPYIPIGENKKKIEDFLIGEEAPHAVCANMWGHGGVGKTATIQSYCFDLLGKKKRYFSYIIFLSAKDRFFNVFKNKKEKIEDKERIGSFESLIVNINKILQDDENAVFDLDVIKNHRNGKILLIIDDFETFLNEDRIKIDDFVRKLDPHHHKVIITTRATIGIGTSNIDCNELNDNQTVEFIRKALDLKFPNRIFQNSSKYYDIPENKRKIREITLGRPIRIWQFIVILEQIGDFDEVVEHFSTSETSELNDFFYDRYYEYLSPDAQIVWDVMGQLTYDEDLINVFDKVKYVLKWDEKEDKFNSAIKELEKLRVIEIINDDRYKIWSKDILNAMKETFEELRVDSDYINKGNILQRVKFVNKDKSLSLTENLLISARENKALGRSLEEIKSGYKHIIGREEGDIKTRLKALIDLVTYYIVNLDDRESAIQECQYNERLFSNEAEFVKIYSKYCYEHDSIQLKNKSVEILFEFLNKANIVNKLPQEDKLELLGLLVVRRRKLLKVKLDKLNIEKTKGKIPIDSIKQQQNEILRQFQELISKFGRTLFDEFKLISFKDKGKETETITGLRHLVEVCYIVKDFDFAKNICDFVIENHSRNIHFKNQFIDLKKRLPSVSKKTQHVDYLENIISYILQNFKQGGVFSKSTLGPAVKNSTGKSATEIFGFEKTQPIINRLIELDKIELVDSLNFLVKGNEIIEENSNETPITENDKDAVIPEIEKSTIKIVGKIDLSSFQKELPQINQLVRCKITGIHQGGKTAYAIIDKYKVKATIYIGDLIFKHIDNLHDFLKISDEFDAVVKKIDENNQVNLSLKLVYKLNDEIECVVKEIFPSYAIVEFPSIFPNHNNEGRISNWEIKDTYTHNIDEYLEIGKKYKMLIIGNDKTMLNLSMKRLNKAISNDIDMNEMLSQLKEKYKN